MLNLTSSGKIALVPASSGSSVRPVLFLKSGIVITSGEGTAEEPYNI